MKIAILKGNRLNPWHIKLYERTARIAPSECPLEFTAFTTTDNLFDHDSLEFRVEVVPYEYEAGPLWKRLLSRYRYRRLHQEAGYDFAPFRLEERLQPFDIIQSWEMFTRHSQAAIRAASRSNAKTLITVWDDIPHNAEQYRLRAEIKNEVRPQADRFLVYTEAARRSLLEEGVPEKKIDRIRPSIDLTPYLGQLKHPEEWDAQWFGEKPFVILFAGRFVPEKGIYDLLDAVTPLTGKDSSIRLLYIGSGSEEESLERKIIERNLTDFVRILPRRPYHQMPSWIRSSHVVVLPSRPRSGWREQFGMIAMEAMAATLPVIVSRAPGPEEILGDIPIWIDPGQASQIQKALESLIESPHLQRQKGTQGQRWATEKFDQIKNAPQLLAIYQRLVEK